MWRIAELIVDVALGFISVSVALLGVILGAWGLVTTTDNCPPVVLPAYSLVGGLMLLAIWVPFLLRHHYPRHMCNACTWILALMGSCFLLSSCILATMGLGFPNDFFPGLPEDCTYTTHFVIAAMILAVSWMTAPLSMIFAFWSLSPCYHDQIVDRHLTNPAPIFIRQHTASDVMI